MQLPARASGAALAVPPWPRQVQDAPVEARMRRRRRQ
jgi:hypothetical protein